MKTPKRVVGPLQLTNAAVTEYTVPAATKTIIRHIHCSNPTGGGVTLTISIGASAAGTRIYDAYSIAAGNVLDVWVYYVMETTEILQALASAGASLVLIVDADEYTLG